MQQHGGKYGERLHVFHLETINILTHIAMRGRAQGPSRCFIPKSMDSKPKAGNIAKDNIGEGKVEIFGNLERGVGRYNVEDRQRTPLIISTLLAILLSGSGAKKLSPIMDLSGSEVNHKLSKVDWFTIPYVVLELTRIM